MVDVGQTFYFFSQGNLVEYSTKVHNLGLKLNILFNPVTQLTILMYLAFIILFIPLCIFLLFLYMHLFLGQKLILLLVLGDKPLIKGQVIVSPVLQFLDLLHLLPKTVLHSNVYF